MKYYRLSSRYLTPNECIFATDDLKVWLEDAFSCISATNISGDLWELQGLDFFSKSNDGASLGFDENKKHQVRPCELSVEELNTILSQGISTKRVSILSQILVRTINKCISHS